MPYRLPFGGVRQIAYPRKSIHSVTVTILYEVSCSIHVIMFIYKHTTTLWSADWALILWATCRTVYLSTMWTKKFVNQASWNLHALLPWSCRWSHMYQNPHGLARSNSVFSLSLFHQACLLSLSRTPSYRLDTGNHSVTAIVVWKIEWMPAENGQQPNPK